MALRPPIASLRRGANTYRSRGCETRPNARWRRLRSEGNTEGTPTRGARPRRVTRPQPIPATSGISLVDATRVFPRFPPRCSMVRRVSGSSPEEGLKFLQIGTFCRRPRRSADGRHRGGQRVADLQAFFTNTSALGVRKGNPEGTSARRASLARRQRASRSTLPSAALRVARASVA